MASVKILLLAACIASCSGEANQAVELPSPAELPPAPKPEEVKTPLKIPVPGQSVQNAVEVLESDLWQLVTGREYQGTVAIVAFVFGLIALFDGCRLFRLVVLTLFSAAGFLVALSQLQAPWEKHGEVAKYAAAAGVALFVGYAANRGWEGTQLLMGTIFGLYVFRTEQDLAALAGFAAASQQPAWLVVIGSVCVAAGITMVNDRYGGPKILGFFASLLGGSLVVSAIGFFSMFTCTLPSPPIHVHVTPAQVASVYEFWYMMAFPMSSEPVGLFTVTDKNTVVGSHRLDWDRVLCIFFWMLFFVGGTRFQFRAANSRKIQASDLKTRLLNVEGRGVIAIEAGRDVGFEGQVIKIEGDHRSGFESQIIKIES